MAGEEEQGEEAEAPPWPNQGGLVVEGSGGAGAPGRATAGRAEPGAPAGPPDTVPAGFGKQPHPMDAASAWSQLTWDWLRPLMHLSMRRQMHAADIWPLPRDEAAHIQLVLYRQVRLRLGDSVPLWRVMAHLHWRRWAWAGVLYVVWCFSAGLQPFIVRAIVAFMAVRCACMLVRLLTYG